MRFEMTSDAQRAVTSERLAQAIDVATFRYWQALQESLGDLVIMGDVSPDTDQRFWQASLSAAWEALSLARVTRDRASELGWDPEAHG